MHLTGGAGARHRKARSLLPLSLLPLRFLFHPFHKAGAVGKPAQAVPPRCPSMHTHTCCLSEEPQPLRTAWEVWVGPTKKVKRTKLLRPGLRASP